MIRVIKHRGPDDTGFYSDGQVGVANARLSIIDIEGGHQPQQNEDGTVHVTYNGEIYNFQPLRAELEKAGHKFSTKSDTEVIVHGYEQFGDAYIQKLNGMFAIAIWDAVQKKLLLARDRMGIKPLYYTIQDRRIYFASEIKALLQANLKRSVDPNALYSILNVGYIPGERTLIAGIKKLPPSSILNFRDGEKEVSKYWQIPPQSETDQEETTRDLRAALQDSIRDQLVADVPVGCFLSGGLDTSAIVAFASKAVTQPLKTFCLGFGEETDELQDARLIAEHFGTDHHELIVDSSQGMRLYPRMIWHMEAPKYNLYPWFVCELVRKYVTVCLSGNGGDEVFGGYVARYQHALRIERLSHNPSSSLLRIITPLEGISRDMRTRNRFRILRALGDQTREYLILAGAMPESLNKKLFKNVNYSTEGLLECYAPFFPARSSFLENLMKAELRTKLVDDLLSVDDSMSMAHSLELRVPLIDNRIVDLMTPLPWQLKFRGGSGKILLRQVVKDLLPKKSLQKPKWGFSVDVNAWYQGEAGELIHQIVPDSSIINQYFSKTMIQKLIDRAGSSTERRYQILLWQLLGFHFWHRIFVDGERPENVPLEVAALTN